MAFRKIRETINAIRGSTDQQARPESAQESPPVALNVNSISIVPLQPNAGTIIITPERES